MPRPTRWTDLGGHTQLSVKTRILVDPRSRSTTALPAGRAELPGPASRFAQDLAKQLRTEVTQVSGVTPPVGSDIRHARTGDIVLLGSKAGALELQLWGTGKVGFTHYGAADHSFDHTLPLNQWGHLTWVTEPGRTTLDANGEHVGTVGASIPLPLRSIGTEKAGPRGDLDEVATWDEALSPEQVRADYAHYDR